ncbi:MAG: hypothetical protein ACK2UA_13015 [Anaerolineae bacterium]|jgi:ribonuclease BN (tRNA processing enzyme)
MSSDSHITSVARSAAEVQVGRLVLIRLSSLRPEHSGPELDHAHPISPRTESAYDGIEIEF